MEKPARQEAKVKSADRVLDILELLAAEKEPMNLMDIATRLALPVSSAYKLIQNLLTRGYIETDRSGKMFRIGYKVLEIATTYVQNTDLTAAFQWVAQKIVDDMKESVFLSIRSGDKILYVAERQSHHPVRFVSHLGMKLPLHATAMGKIFLSGMSDEELAALYPDRDLGKLTASTISNYEALQAQLADIRREGIAYSDGEAAQGVRCVAAPILNASGRTAAAMSISIPDSRIDDAVWQQAKDRVLQGARELSLNLYYKPNGIGE